MRLSMIAVSVCLVAAGFILPQYEMSTKARYGSTKLRDLSTEESKKHKIHQSSTMNTKRSKSHNDIMMVGDTRISKHNHKSTTGMKQHKVNYKPTKNPAKAKVLRVSTRISRKVKFHNGHYGDKKKQKVKHEDNFRNSSYVPAIDDDVSKKYRSSPRDVQDAHPIIDPSSPTLCDGTNKDSVHCNLHCMLSGYTTGVCQGLKCRCN